VSLPEALRGARSRYLVGIDLGTTHTVVAYADGEAPGRPVAIFPIPQLVAPGAVATRLLLPSARYHPVPGEIAVGDGELPWRPAPSDDPVPEAVIGVLAQELGSKVPGRLVTSAKSWLSHSGVDRTAAVLPWGAAPDVPRISPVDASASYLRHVRHAWNMQFPADRLEDQDVVLTVPASFDETARQLTVAAARLAGLPRVRLVEEPQAACYDWLARHAEDLERPLTGVQTVLVCDVGGGTTDFTLIRVDRDQGHPRLMRIGVGDHLMLGGDNMDLALAHLGEKRLLGSGGPLSAAQLSQLVQQCRSAKERLLAHDAPETASVTVLGAGARLIGQARSLELTREEVEQLVVDGFFPETGIDDVPLRRRGGIVEFGLPYAADPAVTRHLSAFHASHAQVLRGATEGAASPGGPVQVPDAVLLNGGVFHSEAISRRLLGVLQTWRGHAPVVLSNDDPDLAVARGAVAYALARRGHGARIGGGSARSILLPIEETEGQARRAVCLLPRGSDEGHELRLEDRVFSLRLGQPVRINLLTTTSDLGYAVGQIVDVDPEHVRALPPLVTVLPAAADVDSKGREVPVQLAAMLTDVGTLEIDCVATDEAPADRQRRWRMEFQLRGAGLETAAVAPTALPATFAKAVERIDRVYGARDAGVDPKETRLLQRDLEKLLGGRNTWDIHLLRELFGVLWTGARRRRRSADHERLWLNLIGFCLRPGYGHPLDEWRVQQLWSIYGQGVQYRDDPRIWAEWWTTWRRVAGGLNRGQQLRILNDVEGPLRRLGQRSSASEKTAADDDMLRLAAALERLPAGQKTHIGELLLAARRRPTDAPQRWWALGRLGARVPFHGSVHDVVPRGVASSWLERILMLDWQAVGPAAFAAAQLARLSGDRERDLTPDLRELVVERLRKDKAPQKWMAMVEAVTELDDADESLVFGESLPPGLRLVS
jgi:molecular chaperone DnaK (HSP70)